MDSLNLTGTLSKRPCWVEINTRAFEDNYKLLVGTLAGNATPIELLAIVKADAYGHGLELCAPAAVRAGARWLGVTSVEEGVTARRLCPDAEILVISGVFSGQGAALIEHRLTALVWEHWQLDELEAAARLAGSETGSVPVHLELDTGMSRQGVGEADLGGILARFSSNPLKLDGLMTHLYAADESDGVVTGEQMAHLESFVERALATFAQHGQAGSPRWLQVGNSAAVSAGDEPGTAIHKLRKLSARFGLHGMMRPGLALYGLTPEFEPEEPAQVAKLREQLRPVLTWKTQVVTVHAIQAGQAVGYNGTFIATEPMRVALLAVGYADGLKRTLSNRGTVLVRGQRAPIVGRVSMDQTVVDVTEIAGVQPGDEVVLLGAQGSDHISAEEHARWAGTVSWEIFTSIGPRVERREANRG